MARWKKVGISFFILAWSLLFHYESLRAFYLSPLAGRPLPKFPLLYPVWGWDMYYFIPNLWVGTEVYGVKKNSERPAEGEARPPMARFAKGDQGRPERLDPHRFLRAFGLGFDPVRLHPLHQLQTRRELKGFCRALERKFPEYEGFFILRGGFSQLAPQRSPKTYYPPHTLC